MPLKGLSFDEIVKKEMDEGKDQKQAVAIAYSVTGKNKKNEGNYLTSKERFHSMEERTRRGTERYAAKPVRYAEDEASAEEHESQYEELARKKANSNPDITEKTADKDYICAQCKTTIEKGSRMYAAAGGKTFCCENCANKYYGG